MRHKTLFYNYITRMREHIENRAEYLAAEMLLKESGLNIVEAATLALELVQLCGGSRCSMRRARKAIELGAEELKNGEQIFVEGMKSNQGKEFNANLQYSAERRGIEFIFPKDQAFNQQTLGGVPLSPMQLKALNEGHTILVEDMKRKNGELFSSFVTMDKVTGGLQYLSLIHI